MGWAVGGWAAAAALFHIWTAYAGVWEPREMRATHLLFLLPLAFLLFPATRRSPTDRATRWDAAGAALSLVPCAYVILNAHALTERWEGVHPVTTAQVVLGTLMVLAVLESARRSVGVWFFVTTLAFIAFLVLAPWLPGFLKSPRAYSYPQIVEMFFLYADEGVLGTLTGISSNILMIFILFASFMLHSGVGQFFMDISVALAGRFRGGPAKVAVLSSGLYGTISGSSVADCYATGSFSIPLMKKIGYKPEIAGAIEACASCGGPLMPPIMGAGAFIMSELTGVPYAQIIVAAALPAVLYYAGIMATVHWEALKHGMGAMTDDVPSVAALARRSLLFVPFAVVVYFLEKGYSPSKAALYSLLTAVVVSWFAGAQPMTPKRIFETMGEAMRSGVIVACVLAASGLIVAAMSRTGFALAFSSAIINLSAGHLIVALVLIFAVVSVLGTGIPTTPAYILAVTVGGAALQKLDVDILAAHLFVFYYAVLADVTPPVAVTAFAGAQMAGADPMRTGWQASRVALSGFLAPFLFVYQPALLMRGARTEILVFFACAVIALSVLSAAAAGHM
ncbi:MAG: TRAP transporter fused permease subunit, partial [Candidatus Rokubacteria bacterium]|nr:TRAP transporter fused permease subunit [Candidatus Rokubacteria bacterium]